MKIVALKSKMYSIQKIDGKDHNTVKGVSIAIEFDKYKGLIKKIELKKEKI